MPTRREFLRAAASVGGLGYIGGLGMLSFPETCVAETNVDPKLVQLKPAIEPLVRLIERTPRERCFEVIADQLRKGLPYRNFLAALYLAGIRNVSPQPPGFKFHCVFVVHAAHQMSLDAPVSERLYPLFWALDYFKVAQAQDAQEGDFRLAPVAGKLPSASDASREFHLAMEAWDEERADRAIIALTRSRGAQEIIGELWRYGARDYRNIGHKAIFVANTWRTLQTIGWQHAEPALRSLVLGLLDFGASERVNEFAYEDQCYIPNLERARGAIGKLPSTWTQPRGSQDATLELYKAIRQNKVPDACTTALEHLKRGASAQVIWDAVHLMAGELMMRQPGIYGIHTVTSTNGLHYAYETCADPETRLLLLLQGVGWLGQFRDFMVTKPQGLGTQEIVSIATTKSPTGKDTVGEILELVGKDSKGAAQRAMGLAGNDQAVQSFRREAYRLILQKATDAHDFKYATAVFEDYGRVSPTFRPHQLATAVYHLKGKSMDDSPVMTRTREVLGG